MENAVKYKGLADRKKIADEQNLLGRRMTQDNFDSDYDRQSILGHWDYPNLTNLLERTWIEGVEPRGTMVFTDEPEICINPVEASE